MSKIQTIICLFIFIVIIFSMDMIFGNPLRETFKGIEMSLVGAELNTLPNAKLRVANPDYTMQSDDQPLFYSFPFL
jgi:hypothetical protein